MSEPICGNCRRMMVDTDDETFATALCVLDYHEIDDPVRETCKEFESRYETKKRMS